MPGFNVGRQFQDCNNLGLQQGGSFEASHSTETARSNRFRIQINLTPAGTSISDVVEFFCESIDRPIRKILKETVWNGGDFLSVPLRQTPYDPINIVFYEILRDDSSDSSEGYNSNGSNFTVERLLDWWTRGVYNASSSRVTYPSSRKTSVSIQQLSGSGNVIWQYHLARAWPEVIQGSQLNHSVSDISKTTISLSFDRILENSEPF